MTSAYEGLLLLGPTGSGKTPLGQELMHRGFRGRPCIHFDFGENLRQLAQRTKPNTIVSPDDIEFIRHLLQTGALLEDRDFPIAQRVLQSFLTDNNMANQPLIVLNGLPRHVGQAEAVAGIINIRHVVLLDCTPETVLQRIGTNSGGDRAQRVDDSIVAIRKKLTIYADRTAPLVDFYRQRRAPIINVAVTVAMTASDAWEEVRGER